jgi:hypothetical protein
MGFEFPIVQAYATLFMFVPGSFTGEAVLLVRCKPYLRASHRGADLPNQIGDRANWAPIFRCMGSSWRTEQLGQKQSSAAPMVGLPIVFSSSYVLDAIRQNGSNQKKWVTQSQSSSENTAAPTIYTLSQHLKAAVNMEAAVAIEHQFGKVATVSATYINSRGVHQYNRAMWRPKPSWRFRLLTAAQCDAQDPENADRRVEGQNKGVLAPQG